MSGVSSQVSYVTRLRVASFASAQYRLAIDLSHKFTLVRRTLLFLFCLALLTPALLLSLLLSVRETNLSREENEPRPRRSMFLSNVGQVDLTRAPPGYQQEPFIVVLWQQLRVHIHTTHLFFDIGRSSDFPICWDQISVVGRIVDDDVMSGFLP